MTLVPNNKLQVIQEMNTVNGKNVAELSFKHPVCLIFLRHFGCVFCKEALHDISELRAQIEDKNVELVFVHMAQQDIADEYFKEFKLSGVLHISNPHKDLYRAFGLMKGTVSQLYGLSTWIRGFGAQTKQYKLEVAEHLGDSTQMPGMFLIKNGEVTKQFIHRRASQRPDYQDFLSL